MKLTRLQRRVELVNHLWYFKLCDFWMKTFEGEAYSAYDEGFNYVPRGKGNLTNPSKIAVSETISDEIKLRLSLYSPEGA